MKFKLDAKIFFFILIAANILLVGATLAVFTFASSAAQKKSENIAQLKADEQTNEQTLNYYKVLQSTLKVNKDIATTVQKVLPADKDQTAAFADLDYFSKTTGVAIQQITFNPGTNKGSGQTLTSPAAIKGVNVISVTLHCEKVDYGSLLTFLKTIETTQRRMQITTLNITPNNTDANLMDQVDLTLDIYLKSKASS